MKQTLRLYITTISSLIACLVPPTIHATMADFRKAIKDNDLDKCKEIHAQNPQLIHEKNIAILNNLSKCTPLIFAVRKKRLNICKWLVEQKADINETDALLGGTALTTALFFRHKPISKYLIEQGADVNKGNPLITAVNSTNDLELCQLLIDRNADVNAQDSEGDTPLHEATDNLEIARCLLDAGAKPNIQNKEGKTPLHNAAAEKNTDVARILLALDNIEIKEDNLGRKPIHYVINPDMVTLLKEKEPDLNVTDNEGNTPLHTLLSLNTGTGGQNLATCRALLDNGVNPDTTNNNNQTFLQQNGIAPQHRSRYEQTLNQYQSTTPPITPASPSSTLPNKLFQLPSLKIVIITLIITTTLIAIPLALAKISARKKKKRPTEDPQEDDPSQPHKKHPNTYTTPSPIMVQ